jgi:hypothetical protein
MDSNPRSPGHGELCRAPYRSLLRRAGGGEVGTAVQPDFFCSASHSIEPGAYTVLVGCGLSRCSAASAFRRYNSYIPSLFIGSTSNSLNARTYQGINAVR